MGADQSTFLGQQWEVAAAHEAFFDVLHSLVFIGLHCFTKSYHQQYGLVHTATLTYFSWAQPVGVLL